MQGYEEWGLYHCLLASNTLFSLIYTYNVIFTLPSHWAIRPLKWHCTYPNGYTLQAKFISWLSRYKVCNTGIQVYAVGIFSLLHDTKLQQELRSYYNSEHTCARTHTYVPYLVILWIIFYHFFNILQFWNQVFVQVFQDLPPEIRRNFT